MIRLCDNTFSLVVATYGREKEVDLLLGSIAKQDYNLDLIEVIIVDQNVKNNLGPIIEKYEDILKIKHIRSKKKGASFNRNIGIQCAKGDILAFPDDDCLYYPDTLKSVNEEVNRDDTVSCFLGRIFDYSTGKNIVRNWKKYSFYVNWWNFYQNYSEIVTFVKRKDGCDFCFCEQLGPGTDFGSCEGVDYLTNFLREGLQIKYVPNISVWHRQESIDMFDIDKNYYYGMGFGAFCRKNLNIPIFILFLEVLVYHALIGITALLSNNKEKWYRRKICIMSRVNGWIKWS